MAEERRPSCFSLGYSLASQYLPRDVKLQSSLSPQLWQISKPKSCPGFKTVGSSLALMVAKRPLFRSIPPQVLAVFTLFAMQLPGCIDAKGFRGNF